MSNIEDMLFNGSRTDHVPTNQAWIRAPFNSIAALKACMRKYFIEASTFRGENLEHSRGTKANVLVSRPTQIINHFSDDTTISVPATTVKPKKTEITRCIELEGNLTLNNLIIS